MRLEIFSIRPYRQAFIMPKTTIIMELDVPASFLLFRLRRHVYDLVAYDLDVVGFRPDELYEESADDGRHAGGEDYDGDVGFARPFVEGGEVRVEFYVLGEELDTLREGRGDAVDHFLEGVSVASRQHIVWDGAAREWYRNVRLPLSVSSLPFLRSFSPNPRLSVW